MSNKEQSINPQELLLLLDSITVYREVLTSNPLLTLQELLEELSSPEPDLRLVYRKYHELCGIFSKHNWDEIMFDLILNTENDFTRARTGTEISQIEELVRRDLNILQQIANLTAQDIKLIASQQLAQAASVFAPMFSEILQIDNWPIWKNKQVFEQDSMRSDESQAVRWLGAERKRIIEKILSFKEWEEGVTELSRYYRTIGSGKFSSFVAFRWVRDHHGYLEGIDRPDSIRKVQLIGQAREQGIVLENTEHFIHGYPANNVILYGDRGTGKSSLVKALLNEYARDGLRLIELHKADLADYHLIIRLIKEQPHKFIIFIDDLSFDDAEPEYKALKTLLEGGIEVRPANVLIYATSNRRHLVKETFSERQGNDVHVRDNQEEKLSLSDRFGITVTFPAPDQEGYLRIVEGLAAQHELEIDREELRQQALRWLLMHNGRSGRTARQFIDYLIGTLSSK